MGKIRERIPVGFEHHSKDRTWNGFQEAPDIPVIMRELNAARRQLGTLGGGNHFIELQRSMSGELWIMIHSGSRNFGLQIAHEYHEIAKDICARKRLEIPEKDLAYLPIGTSEADQYLEAMQFALAFAKQNRLEMIDVVRHAVSEALPGTRFDDVINIHHNYAAKEEHYGRSVFVHRKGATSARTGEIGIIPGSQGTKSYIVRGKGNPESFMSCSHGAGRKMGRKQAMRELSLAKEKLRMDEMGIVHGIRTAKDLDEAPGAYKDIERVMANQADLVEIVEELVPLAVIKG